MISYKMARRSFLHGCGGSAALLYPLLRGIEARAAGAPAPPRFLVIHHPLGTQPAKWRPAASATTTTFTLPAISAPFEPLRQYMVMIDGLNIVSATVSPTGYAGSSTHEGGMVALMTGQPTLGQIGQQDHVAKGASIDQLFLAQSPVLGALGTTSPTPFGSLQLAADIRSDRDEIAPRTMSYLDSISGQTNLSLARRPLAPETIPINTFNRIFGGPLPTGTTAADTARLLARKRSILDFMRSDLARMRTLVPASEKVRLDTQADAIQKLEASVTASLQGVQTTATCQRPVGPEQFTQSGAGASGMLAPKDPNGNPLPSHLTGVDYYDPTDPTNHPHQRLGQAQLAIIRAAFACDLARVATFMWSAGTNWVVFPGGLNGARANINGVLGPASTPHHPPSHTTDVNTLAWLAQVDSFYAQQTSLALQQFVATADFDGNNLLDNTVVAYVSEVGRASDHNQYNMPYLVFGGKNTRIVQGGTFLKVTDGHLTSLLGDGSDPTNGLKGPAINRPTNDVWLALAPIFGVNMPALGDPTQYQGPLPGLVV